MSFPSPVSVTEVQCLRTLPSQFNAAPWKSSIATPLCLPSVTFGSRKYQFVAFFWNFLSPHNKGSALVKFVAMGGIP